MNSASILYDAPTERQLINIIIYFWILRKTVTQQILHGLGLLNRHLESLNKSLSIQKAGMRDLLKSLSTQFQVNIKTCHLFIGFLVTY